MQDSTVFGEEGLLDALVKLSEEKESWCGVFVIAWWFVPDFEVDR